MGLQAQGLQPFFFETFTVPDDFLFESAPFNALTAPQKTQLREVAQITSYPKGAPCWCPTTHQSTSG
jgi:signal-transduction protein with cAMP-binding, CBS, and nucleotidyltransferase domain